MTAGLQTGRFLQPPGRSEDFSRRFVRLPRWEGMPEDGVSRVLAAVSKFVVL